MPHIIVEYAENILTEDEVSTVLNTIHTVVSDSGLFDASHIKTRAYPFKQFTNAGGSEPYLHVQARIKSGRDSDNKKLFSNQIMNALVSLNIPAAVMTVEIIDMDRETYSRHKP